MRVAIETERAILRPFEKADAEAAFGWFGNPVVMRFTPGGPDISLAQTEARVAKYREHQIAHGFSKWVVFDRRTKVPMGDSGLLVLNEGDWIDLGFRLAQPYWGQGLATEVGAGWVRVAFDELHLDRLNAMVHPGNVASIRVLAKLGFREERRATVMDMDSILFSLKAKNAGG